MESKTVLTDKSFGLCLQLCFLLVGEGEDVCSPCLSRNGDACLVGQHVGLDEVEQLGEFGTTVGGGSLASSPADGQARLPLMQVGVA